MIYETIPVADFYHFEQSNAKVMDKCNDEDEMMKSYPFLLASALQVMKMHLPLILLKLTYIPQEG